MVKFTFNQDLPEEVKSAFLKASKELECLIPTWCGLIDVNFDNHDENAIASFNILYHYRRAHLFLHTGFLLESAEERRRTIMHEYAHLTLAPFANWVKEAINQSLTPENTLLAKNLLSQWETYNEGVTCDLTTIFERNFPCIQSQSKPRKP